MSVVFLIEHAETSGISSPALQYWNGGSWQSASCSFTTNVNDHTNTCNITSYFNTAEKLDKVSLRFLVTKSPGGTNTLTVDYTHLNISVRYQDPCVYLNGTTGGGIGNNPPVISMILLEDNVDSPSDELDLNPGTQKAIQCNATVQDNDGYANIQTVNATLYASTSSLTAPDNNQKHYTNTSCTRYQQDGNYANYTCSFSVWYYATNGTWTCSFTATDGESVSTAVDTATMNELYALSISPSLLDYGDLSEGDVSSELIANVTNFGNMAINVSVKGYGAEEGDGLSFVCDQENIVVGAERYAIVSSPYGSKSALTDSFVNSKLKILAATGAARSWNLTFWQLQIPTTGEPRGQCDGTIVFQAESS